MKKSIFSIILILFSLNAAAENKSEILVAAAPSVKMVVEKAAEIFMKKNADVSIKFSFAATGAIQNQIENGAPIDVFIAVGGKNMSELEKKGYIVSVEKQVLAEDELVLAALKESSINSIEDLYGNKVKLIANGEPSIVPCSKTVEETMGYLGKYDVVKPKFVNGKDLMQVLYYVESGNADAGFIWKSIALKSDKIKIIFEADSKMHKQVLIEAAPLKESKNITKDIEFINYLKSIEIQEMFKKSGFNIKK